MENKPVTETRPQKQLSYNRLESVLSTTGKLTPQAVDMEEAVLGALMIDGNAVSNVLDILQPNMFYVEANGHIYRSIHQLFDLSRPIDLLTVTEKLRQDKLLDMVGGASYLASLTNRISSSANIEYHARVVMEKYVLRELITNCSSIITDAYDDAQDVLNLLDAAETKIFNIIENNFKRDSKALSDVVKTALDQLNAMRENSGQLQGVPCGIRAIDDKTGGWKNSDLVILAARPGMGKTSFVLTIARNAALDFDKKVAFFSLEMPATQLAMRLFSMESGINGEKITQGNMDETEWTRLMSCIGPLESANLIIDDTPALSVFDLRAKCRRLKHKNDIQLVIIDYLQLMQGNTENKKQGNREQEISYISRSLKALAKELDVPVIALSQLSRATESRGERKRPQLSDLRESGSIEQDADQVLFIYRPEYYHLETFEDESPSAGMADIMFEKNRHGSTGNVRVRFQSQFTKFTDLGDSYFGTDGPPTESHAAALMPGTGFSLLESGINYDDNTGTPHSEPDLNDDLPY